jgi:hypothetical protein
MRGILGGSAAWIAAGHVNNVAAVQTNRAAVVNSTSFTKVAARQQQSADIYIASVENPQMEIYGEKGVKHGHLTERCCGRSSNLAILEAFQKYALNPRAEMNRARRFAA